jgi:hypothetical protein
LQYCIFSSYTSEDKAQSLFYKTYTAVSICNTIRYHRRSEHKNMEVENISKAILYDLYS